MPEVADLAQANPGLTIIINHLGTAEPATYGPWKAGLRVLAKHPNIAIKLSGLWTIDKNWSPDALRPFIAGILEQIGPDRLMYGSNSPVEKVSCPVASHIPRLASLLHDLDPATLSPVLRIRHGVFTACRMLGRFLSICLRPICRGGGFRTERG